MFGMGKQANVSDEDTITTEKLISICCPARSSNTLRTKREPLIESKTYVFHVGDSE
jgi:hypothetical protein